MYIYTCIYMHIQKAKKKNNKTFALARKTKQK